MTRRHGTPWRIALLMVVLLPCGVTPALGQTGPWATDPIQRADASPMPVAPPAASAPQDVLSVPSVPRLFGDTVGDFKRLPSVDSLKWLAIGTAGALAARPADTSLTRNLFEARQLDEPMEAGAIRAARRSSWARPLPRTRWAARRIIHEPRTLAPISRAQLIAQATTYAVKFSVNRTRPDDSSYLLRPVIG
jgi:hypothetical protein